jgi:hypothetical protein
MDRKYITHHTGYVDVDGIYEILHVDVDLVYVAQDRAEWLASVRMVTDTRVPLTREIPTLFERLAAYRGLYSMALVIIILNWEESSVYPKISRLCLQGMRKLSGEATPDQDQIRQLSNAKLQISLSWGPVAYASTIMYASIIFDCEQDIDTVWQAETFIAFFEVGACL